MLAEQLLIVTAEFPLALRPELAALSPGILQTMGTGLGDIIAGLEAVDVAVTAQPGPGPAGGAVRQPAHRRARDRGGAQPMTCRNPG